MMKYTVFFIILISAMCIIRGSYAQDTTANIGKTDASSGGALISSDTDVCSDVASTDAVSSAVAVKKYIPDEPQTKVSPVLALIVSVSEKIHNEINIAGQSVENAMVFSVKKTSYGILYADGIVEDILTKIFHSRTTKSLKDVSRKTIDDIRTSPVAETVGNTAKTAYSEVGEALNIPAMTDK